MNIFDAEFDKPENVRIIADRISDELDKNTVGGVKFIPPDSHMDAAHGIQFRPLTREEFIDIEEGRRLLFITVAMKYSSTTGSGGQSIRCMVYNHKNKILETHPAMNVMK
jgi:hypothetical protein